MARYGHGDDVQFTKSTHGKPKSESPFAMAESVSGGEVQPDFGYMFSTDPNTRPAADERLPEDGAILDQLAALAEAMGSINENEPDSRTDRVQPGDRTVAAGYTYFGQFIDHDITVASGGSVILSDPLTPLTSLETISNGRTPLLELDSVYGPSTNPGTQVPPPNGTHMVLNNVSRVGTVGSDRFLLIPGKSDLNDLPRKPRSADPSVDREALIGDPRNDENLIVAQLHVAFLKAHNSLADIMNSFKGARDALTLMYQSAVIDDFLPRVCDADTLNEILTNGPRFFTPTSPQFMPVEFSAAAYRFGHSMVRSGYDFNVNFSPAGSNFLFTFTALSGNLSPSEEGDSPDPSQQGSDNFPHNWIIEWERFLELGGSKPQRARPIDTHITPILADLRDTFGNTQQGNIAPRLALRNLRRGYWLSVPTGQSVAAKMGVAPIEVSAATTGLDSAAIAPFTDRTPLWLYVLAEAGLNSGKLGKVGTTILAETFYTMISRSKPSIFDSNGNRTSTARHSLTDIIKLASLQDN